MNGEHPLRSTHRPLGRAWTALAIAALIVTMGAPARAAAASTFPASQETIIVGSSDGVSRAQADDGIMETLTETDVAPDPVVYPGTETVTTGTLASGNFSTDLLSSDDAYVQYREAVAPPTSTLSNTPAQNGTGCGWSSCPNGNASDDLYASSSLAGAGATYRGLGFALPADAAIIRVEVGIEAYEPSGNDRIAAAVSWDGGTTYCPSVQVNLPGADPNAYTYANLTACGSHPWAGADFAADNIVTRLTHVQVGGVVETLYLDANGVRVMYETNYRLAVRYDWTAIPVGNAYVLTIEAGVSDENVTVEVLTPPSVWSGRLNFTSAGDRTLLYNLTAAEFNAGGPAIRFVDAGGPDDVASDLRVDFVVVTAVTLAYRLDVRQDVSGISGSSPVLVLKGNVSGGGENFNVDVWNVSAGVWDPTLPAAFAAAVGYLNLTLRPEEIDAGTVSVRYTDVNPTNAAPGSLHLDLVAVVANPISAPLDVVPFAAAGVAAAVGVLAFLFLIRRRILPGGEKPREAESGTTAPAPKRATKKVLAPAGTRAVAAILESGHAYLVEEGKPGQGPKLLEDLTRIGRSGLLMTRGDRESTQAQFRFQHTTSVFLGEGRTDAGGDPPTLESIEATIGDFLRENPVGAVLIDDIEFLADGNRFGDVVRFLRRAAAAVTGGKQILLASVRPGTVRPRELDALEQELDVVRLG